MIRTLSNMLFILALFTILCVGIAIGKAVQSRYDCPGEMEPVNFPSPPATGRSSPHYEPGSTRGSGLAV